MSTVRDVIRDALILLNVIGQDENVEVSAADDALRSVNYILSGWNNMRLAPHYITTITGTLTANQNPHSVGSSGNINVSRPLKIETLYIRDGDTDYTVEQISANTYASITNKSTGSNIPTHFYYKASYPLAYIYLYPVPSSAVTLTANVWYKLSAFTSINDTIALPEGYDNALMYALAVELSHKYGRGVQRGDYIEQHAAKLLKDLKAVNYQQEEMTIDSSLLAGDNFNIYRGY